MGVCKSLLIKMMSLLLCLGENYLQSKENFCHITAGKTRTNSRTGRSWILQAIFIYFEQALLVPIIRSHNCSQPMLSTQVSRKLSSLKKKKSVILTECSVLSSLVVFLIFFRPYVSPFSWLLSSPPILALTVLIFLAISIHSSSFLYFHQLSSFSSAYIFSCPFLFFLLVSSVMSVSMRNPPQRRRSLGPVSPKRIYRNLSVRLRGGESSVAAEVDAPKHTSKPAAAVRI